MMTRTLLFAACAAVGSSAAAQLLVYEPFNYTDASLNGQGGALGTTGTWTTTEGSFAGGWWAHPGGSTTGQVVTLTPASTGPNAGFNAFNGTYTNIPYSGGFAGTAAPGDKGGDPLQDNGGGNMDGSIALDPSVTASFTAGTTTWFSYVTARAWDANEGTPQVMLASAASSGGSRGVSLNGGSGIGGGGGPSRFNLQDIYPQYFDAGVNNHAPGGYDYPAYPYPTFAWNPQANATNAANAGTPFFYNGQGTLGTNNGEQVAFGSGNDVTSRGQLDGSQVFATARLDANGDFGDYNVVVMKIEWDADGGKDAISVVAFSSSDVISESAFDAAIAAKPDLSSWNWVGKDEMVLAADGNMYQVTYDDNKPDLDQSTFSLINIQSLKFYIDELRIANGSFSNLGLTVSAIPGDTDGDGDVDDADLGTSFSNYTGPGGTGKTAAEGDTDGDGDVDDGDLGTSFSNYTGPLGPSVPEPTSLALLGLGGLLIARRRRA